MRKRNIVLIIYYSLVCLALMRPSQSSALLIQNPDIVRFTGTILEVRSEAEICDKNSRTVQIKVIEIDYQGRSISLSIEPQSEITLRIDPKVTVEKTDLLEVNKSFTFLAKEILCPNGMNPILNILSWSKE